MHLVTGEEMKRLDDATISQIVPGITLMERAGQGIFEAIADYFDPFEECTVSIFLGSGNNAGDGLVVGRLLAERGAQVILHYCKDPKSLSPDAFKNYVRLKSFRKSGTIEENFLYLADWESKVRESLEESDLVVDALFGTGLTKPITGLYAQVIDLINQSGLLVLSIDIPSGIHGSTGEIMGRAVRADLTVTMALPKIGLFFYPGKEYVGGFRVIDIGIPAQVIENAKIDRHILDFDQALEDLPAIDPASHKFQRGALLIVAGSRRYTGAAHLASVSALRTGCGIVYLAGPASIRPVIQSAAPEVIFISLPETDAGTVHPAALEALAGEVTFDAAAVGPGLTTDEGTVEFVRALVKSLDVPLLLDADGINAFEGSFDELKGYAGGGIIISPHSGELKRLTGAALDGTPLERIVRLGELVAGTGVTLVHKGAPTVIAHPTGRSDVNVAGHPGQATAGSGDVLTGAIAGFLAQGVGAATAARLGVYLHSRAAMIAAEDLGERGMIASDCMEALPLALQELEEEIKYG